MARFAELTELPPTRALVGGMRIVKFHEEDADGQAFSGPKHWHIFDVIACDPAGATD